jgi:hypothetical protein
LNQAAERKESRSAAAKALSGDRSTNVPTSGKLKSAVNKAKKTMRKHWQILWEFSPQRTQTKSHAIYELLMLLHHNCGSYQKLLPRPNSNAARLTE